MNLVIQSLSTLWLVLSRICFCFLFCILLNLIYIAKFAATVGNNHDLILIRLCSFFFLKQYSTPGIEKGDIIRFAERSIFGSIVFYIDFKVLLTVKTNVSLPCKCKICATVNIYILKTNRKSIKISYFRLWDLNYYSMIKYNKSNHQVLDCMKMAPLFKWTDIINIQYAMGIC